MKRMGRPSLNQWVSLDVGRFIKWLDSVDSVWESPELCESAQFNWESILCKMNYL